MIAFHFRYETFTLSVWGGRGERGVRMNVTESVAVEATGLWKFVGDLLESGTKPMTLSLS